MEEGDEVREALSMRRDAEMEPLEVREARVGLGVSAKPGLQTAKHNFKI